jgi:hypothetical protein
LLIRHYRVGWLYPSLAQNQIAALQRWDLIFAFLKNWIRQPRIDKDYVPGRRRDFEGRLVVTSELGLRHACHEIENTNRSKYCGSARLCHADG